AFVLLLVLCACVTGACDAFVLLLLLLRVCVTMVISTARKVSLVMFLVFLVFLVLYGDVCLVFSNFFCCLKFPNMVLVLFTKVKPLCRSKECLFWPILSLGEKEQFLVGFSIIKEVVLISKEKVSAPRGALYSLLFAKSIFVR